VNNVDSLPGVLKVLFEDLGLFGEISYNFACFRVFHSLETCPWLCIFIFKRFLCELSLVFNLPAAAAFYEQYCCLFCFLGHLYW